MSEHQERVWRPRSLIVCHVLTVLLVGSWLLPATRALWDALDEFVFRALNDSRAWGGSWQTFWAWANVREADLVPFVLMLALLAWWTCEGGRRRIGRRAVGVFAFAFALLTICNMSAESLEDVEGWRRRSPTLQLADVQLLSELVPGVDAKDVSGKSFPGDHAIALLAVAGFLWIKAGRRRGLLSLMILSPFMLPRLVSGAHWLTDILIGSVCMLLVIMSWWFATPLAARVTNLGVTLFGLPRRALGRLVPRRPTRTHTT